MRRLGKIFALFVLLLLAGALTLEYLNRSVLPGKVRRWAEESASEAIGRKVTIGSVRLNLWHGFVLEKVAVAEDPRFGTEPFLEADRISGGVLFLPLLKEREALIPALHLVRPRVRLIQGADGRWNFQTLEWKKPTAPAAPPSGPRFRVNVPKVLLDEGSVEVRAVRPAGLPAFRVEKLEADLHLSFPAQVQGTVTAELRRTAEDGGGLLGRAALKGRYLLQKRRMDLEGQSEWQLAVAAPFLPEKARGRLERVGGILSLEGTASGNPRSGLELSGAVSTRGLRWKAARLEGAGDLSGRFRTTLPSLHGLRKAELLKALEGTVTLERMRVGPVPVLGQLRDLSGKVQVDRTGVRTEGLTLLLSTGTPATLSGSVANDPELSFGLRAAASFSVQQPPPLPADWLETLKNLHPSGRLSLEALVNGSLRPKPAFRPALITRFEEIVLEPPGGPRTEIHSGQVRWEPQLFTFTGVTGRLLKKPFSLEGTLVKKDLPEINASFSWGNLEGEAQLQLSSEKIDVESLTGRLGPGQFSLFGEIARPEPDANLYGEISCRAQDLPELWPASAGWVKEHAPQGEVTARCLLQGPLTRPADWTLEFRAEAPLFRVDGVPLQAVSVELRREGGLFTLQSAKAELAGGDLLVSGTLDGSRPDGRWDGKLQADGVQLDELAQALSWKTKDFSGRLHLEWAGGGISGRPASITGSGRMEVTGAQILEFPLLGRFAEFLGLPTLKTIRFQEAKGPFRIKDGRVETQTLLLRSPQAALSVSGWGGFLEGADSPIRWRILPTFAPELVPQESRAQLGRAIAHGVSYFVGEVELLGTWKEPKRKFIPKKVMQILNEQLFNLQDILKGFF